MNFLARIATISAFAAAIGSAAVITTSATLSGANEVPANASTASGNAVVTIDTVTNLLTIQITFAGLIGGNASASHIHCCTAPGSNTGVAVPFSGFPTAASGTYTNTIDLTLTTSYSGAFVTANGGTGAGAEAALISGIQAGRAYVNIHDSTFPGGEVEGFLTPEPASISMMVGGVAALALLRRRKRA